MFVLGWTLLLLISSVTAELGKVFTATSLPDTSPTKFPNSHSFALTNVEDGSFSIYWKIDKPATPVESFHFLLVLDGFPAPPNNKALSNAWMSIAFGSDMRHAEFIVAHLKGNGVELHEHFSLPGYAPPIKKSPVFLAKVLSGGYVNGTLFVEATRPTKGGGDNRDLITDNGFQSLLWAFNPKSDKISDGTYFSYHGPNGPADVPFSQTHGVVSMNLISGQVNNLPIVSYGMLQVHGLGMSLMYLVMIPFGLLLSRYLKSIPNWIYFHATVQSTAVLGIAIFFGIVLMTYQQYTGNHARLGLSIIIFTLFQVIFGGSARRGMIKGDVHAFKWLRYLHRFTGYVILVLSVAQVYLGLNILYPNTETRGKEFWYIYAAVVVFWVVVFGCAEIYYFVATRNLVKAVPEEKDALMSNKKLRTPSDRLATLMALQANVATDDSDKKYTWKSLHEEIQKTGKILVVANGKYVYDASKWIHSHPGGKVILYSVAGTDITMDYFREAGYDASEFVAAPSAPQRTNATHDSPLPHLPQEDMSVYSEHPSMLSNESVMAALQNASYMSEEDWRLVEKSRRTHVHTRLALERLSKIFVGEIESKNIKTDRQLSSSTLLASNAEGLEFDPYEYRRYTLTEKVLLTDDGKSKGNIWKLKFTSLYPYDVRDGQPNAFTNGDCVEIQVRLSNGNVVSRYYTPIYGNLTSFEVIVKMTGGWMTAYLDSQRCGDRQFKIRGPFGSPLVSPPKELPDAPVIPPHLVFITAGSGITPFLQFLTTVVLPVNEALKVHGDYNPQSQDEMQILRGHYVATQCHYYDGWAYGTNLVTGDQGAFPLSLVTPAAGRHYEMLLINCVPTSSDVIGRDLLDAAMLSYPDQIEVHHVVNDLSDGVRDGVTGYLHEGKLDDRLLKEILHHLEPHQQLYSRRAVVCGPNRFMVDVVDHLKEGLGWRHDEVKILSESSY